jgi:glutathione S-transferase
MKLVFDKIQQAKLPFFVKPIAKGIAQKVLSSFVLPNISAQLKFMNEHLAQHAWFAGDSFSAADVQMSFPLEAAAARGGLDTRYPHLQAWLATVHARPAYQRALKAGGPYDILG